MCMRSPIITIYVVSFPILQFRLLCTSTIAQIHTPISALDLCYSHLCRGFEAAYRLWQSPAAPISQRSNNERGLDLLWPSNLPSPMAWWTWWTWWTQGLRGPTSVRPCPSSRALGTEMTDMVLTDPDKSEISDAKTLLINS